MPAIKGRGVTVADLTMIQQLYAAQVQEITPVYGVSMSKWTQMHNAGAMTLDPETLEPAPPRVAGEPPKLSKSEIQGRLVESPHLALLVRFLDLEPETPLFPPAPHPAELFEYFNKHLSTENKLSVTEFAVLFGYQGTVGSRWLMGSKLLRVPRQLMYFLWKRLEEMPRGDREAYILNWIEVVREEGKARGVPDPLKYKTWNREVYEKRSKSSGKRGRKPGYKVKPKE